MRDAERRVALLQQGRIERVVLFSRPAPRSPRASAVVAEITAAEQSWIDAHVELVTETGVDVADAEDLSRCYELWSARWRRINPPERADPGVMVNALGAALGTHLVRRTPVAWGLAEEDGVVDLVLHHGSGDVLLRPLRLVESRWTAEEPSGAFIVATSAQLTSTLSGGRRGRRARRAERSSRP